MGLASVGRSVAAMASVAATVGMVLVAMVGRVWSCGREGWRPLHSTAVSKLGRCVQITVGPFSMGSHHDKPRCRCCAITISASGARVAVVAELQVSGLLRSMMIICENFGPNSSLMTCGIR